jgi:polyisoprenoid-binding protein YceI
MKKFFLFAFVAIIGLMSTTKPAPVTFTVDATKSTFKWTGKKVTGSHWGYIKFSNGSLSVDNGVLKGGSFTVDMNSMDCQDLQGEYAGKLLGHLKADDFFGTDKFPTSTLAIKSATAKGNNAYDVVADLTIKGVTKEITFPATVAIAGNSATATANFMVNRTQFGIKYGSGSFFDNLGDKAINDDFAVEVNLVANAPVAAVAAPKAKTATNKAKSKAPVKKAKAATGSN